MSQKFDYHKVSKVARIAVRGAEVIDYDDRTLSPSGYPPAREMDQAGSGKLSGRPEGSPRVTIQETLEEFRANVLRGEREKAEAKQGIQDRRHKALAVLTTKEPLAELGLIELFINI